MITLILILLTAFPEQTTKVVTEPETVYSNYCSYIELDDPKSALDVLTSTEYSLDEFERDSLNTDSCFCSGFPDLRRIAEKEKSTLIDSNKRIYQQILDTLLYRTMLGDNFYTNIDLPFTNVTSMTHLQIIKQVCSKEMISIIEFFIEYRKANDEVYVAFESEEFYFESEEQYQDISATI